MRLFQLILIYLSLYLSAISASLLGVYENIKGIEAVYQIPKSPKLIVILLHGCSHSATDFFPKNEKCIHCIGLPIEVSIVTDLLTNKAIPLAISSHNRDHKCWSAVDDDPKLISESILYFMQHIVKDTTLPIYLFGASSGGNYASYYAQYASQYGVNIAGVIVQISPLQINTLPPSGYNIPNAIIHMPKDKRMSKYIKHQIAQLSTYFPIKEYIIHPIPLSIQHFSPILNPIDANNFITALYKAGLLNDTYYLLYDPREVRIMTPSWRDTAKRTLSQDIINKDNNLIADISGISELMNVAWASHEISAQYVIEAIQWCSTTHT